jgi:hypothetical protein
VALNFFHPAKDDYHRTFCRRKVKEKGWEQPLKSKKNQKSQTSTNYQTSKRLLHLVLSIDTFRFGIFVLGIFVPSSVYLLLDFN